MEVAEFGLKSDAPTVGATAEVRLAGKRRGTAVLVDKQHLLTAGHVLGSPPQKTSHVVAFPLTGAEFMTETVEFATRKPTDLAVLRLVDPAAGRLPDPIAIWPDDRLPDVVAAFGYPTRERESEGVWREFSVSGQTVSNLHQLRWEEGVGTFVGHSGGPVVDAVTGRLVGVLLAGSQEGRFDRFLSVPEIAALWPSLHRPWRYSGDGAKVHFSRRAHGQRSRAQGGDLFRGRQAALDKIARWLRTSPPGRPLAIIGQPGSGKSAVLGRAAARAEAAGGRGLVHHARSSTADDFLDAVAGFLGLPRPQGTDELIDEFKRRAVTKPITVMIDALDEARSVSDAHVIADAAAELSRLPEVHVVVATRPLVTGNRFAPGTILTRLLVFGESHPNLIDLDVEPYRDREAIREFAEALLAQHGADNPAPAGCAWEAYRARPDLRAGLASIIAERADPNFLVAAITGMVLSTQDEVLDHRAMGFDPNSMPANLDEALEKYFSSLDSAERRQSTGLLTALAYARGAGIADDRWLRFTARLGYAATPAEIDSFRQSRGADYLLQTDSSDGDRTVRLFHQALVDQLREGRPPSDERTIYESLQEEVTTSGGWSNVDSYLTLHIADHALASHRLATLLEDREFIGVADMAALVSTISALAPTDCPEVGRMILQEGMRLRDFGPPERLWLLAMSATHAGQEHIRDQLLGTTDPALLPDWAHALGASYQRLVGRRGAVKSLTIGKFGRDDVIVSGSADGTICVWGHRGELLVDPLVGHDAAVTALALGTVDDDDVLVSGSADGSVRLWNQNGKPIGNAFLGHTRPVTAVGVIRFEGQDAVVSVAKQAEIISWNPEGHVLGRFSLASRLVTIGTQDGRSAVITAGYFNLGIYSPIDGYMYSAPVSKTPKTALAAGRLGNTDVVVCGLGNASIAIWHADGSAARDPLIGLTSAAGAIAVGKLNGSDVVAAAAKADSSLVVWDDRGRILAEPWTGHAGTVNVVTVGPLKARDVVACGGDDRTIRIWDSRMLLSKGRTNSRSQITALAAGVFGGELRIVTAADAQVQLWDVNGNAEPHPLAADVTAVTMGRLAGIDVIVTASRKREVRLWDLDGNLVGEPDIAHTKKITAVVLGTWGDHEILVTASRDNTLQLWEPNSGVFDTYTIPLSRIANNIVAGKINGRDSIVVIGANGIGIRVLDLEQRKWVYRLPPHHSRVTSLTMANVNGRDIISIGCADGRVRTWQPGGATFRVTQDSHAGPVTGLAFLHCGRTTVLVSTASDGVLRIWSDMRRSRVYPLVEPASYLAVAGSAVIAAFGPSLAMLRYTPPPDESAHESPTADAFTTTTTLQTKTPEHYADPRIDPPLTAKRAIRDARMLFDLGDATGAVATLVSGVTRTATTVCAAADMAYGSGQPALVDTVRPYLDLEELMTEPSILGRRFSLAVMEGRLDEAVVAARNISDSVGALREATAGMIQLLDWGSGEAEWQVYRRTTGLADESIAFVIHLGEVAAMRLLAICRRDTRTGLTQFDERRDSLIEEYWTWFSDELAERLTNLLANYGTSGSTRTSPYPYQVISAYEVLHVVAGEDEDAILRADLITALTHHLRKCDTKFRNDFLNWTTYSSVAADVADRLR